jgi:hypothetical protein
VVSMWSRETGGFLPGTHRRMIGRLHCFYRGEIDTHGVQILFLTSHSLSISSVAIGARWSGQHWEDTVNRDTQIPIHSIVLFMLRFVGPEINDCETSYFVSRMCLVSVSSRSKSNTSTGLPLAKRKAAIQPCPI